MFKKNLFLFFFSFFYLMGWVFSAIPATERSALIAFYNATNGDYWSTQSGWKNEPLEADGFGPIGSEGTWYGITVSGDHVTEINMPWHNYLHGTIPPEIGYLLYLERLEVEGEANVWSAPIDGTIPAELGNLEHLKYLFLSYNKLQGNIPASLGNLHHLQIFRLNNNHLEGSIPPELGNLNELKELYLYNNRLTGSIPAELGNLENLESLVLYMNRLTGNIPPELGKLKNLKSLNLRINHLTGIIPFELGNLTSLRALDLFDNSLSGDIPSQLGNLANLQILSLRHNQLSGFIPPGLGNLGNLENLDLSINQLIGSIPPELGLLSQLKELQLSGNQLSGDIPSQLGNLSQLEYLDLIDNTLSGSLPPELGNLTNLEDISLGYNYLNGSIPPWLENLYKLKKISLEYNYLSGSIPPEIGNLKYLSCLFLNNNQLSGFIPSSFTNLTNISCFGIGFNCLKASDPELRAWLDSHEHDWEAHQDLCGGNTLPTIITASVSSISPNDAVCGGNVISDGGTSVTERGVCWSTFSSPDINSSKTTDGSGTGIFTSTITGLTPGTLYYVRAYATNKTGTSYGANRIFTTPLFPETPVIGLNHTTMYFGANTPGDVTDPQTVLIGNKGSGILNWSASANVSWLAFNPSSGTGDGLLSVSINPAGLTGGKYTGTITISDPNASNSPQYIYIQLQVYNQGTTAVPFGDFSTPLEGTSVYSSVPVTGWVLDDIGVSSVKIYNGEVYIGDAVFVDGARPDIERTYPDYPNSNKAGWGYMLLTNFLPNQGNGTFTLYALADDKEGNTVTLGAKTIHVDNAQAVKPFGAIDTPAQGGIISGSHYLNYGWALTPLPNTIPTDGSSIEVWVDGVSLGHPVYNQYRQDVAELFPGYNNSNGAGGCFELDTTGYENGVHTIFWTAIDNAGNVDGIGSRFFTIQNLTGSMQQQCLEGISPSGQIAEDRKDGRLEYWKDGKAPFGQFSNDCGEAAFPTGHDFVNSFEPLQIKKGYNPESEPETLYPDDSGIITIEIRELERLAIYLDDLEILRDAGEYRETASKLTGERKIWPNPYASLKNTPAVNYRGYLMNGTRLNPLPIGSTLDAERGVFYWQPGPGFLGDFPLVFFTNTGGEFKRTAITVRIFPLQSRR